MEIKQTEEEKVSEIKHRTNLDEEELQKNTHHLTLQKNRSNFQNGDGIKMTNTERGIITLQEQIETRQLNKVKELVKEGKDSILTRDLEQSKLLDEYFEILTRAIER